MLPVKEIGEILFKGQITEEETHTCSSKGGDSSSKLAKFNDAFEMSFVEEQHSSRIAFYNHTLQVAFAAAEKLPPAFIPDIVTPPPNC